jgi:hypothetical protein
VELAGQQRGVRSLALSHAPPRASHHHWQVDTVGVSGEAVMPVSDALATLLKLGDAYKRATGLTGEEAVKRIMQDIRR